MAQSSPYAAPEASLGTNNDEKYQPKVLTFKGRIGRLRYLAYSFGTSMAFMLAFMLVSVVAAMLASMFGGMLDQTSGQILLGIVIAIYYIGLIVISVMFMKRRLNDLDKSGWWSLLMIIPFLNLLFALYLIFAPGSEGVNRFGPAPVENPSGIKIFALVLPIFLAIVGILAAIAIPAYQDYVERAQGMQMEQGQ